jgi:hypothetical protein
MALIHVMHCREIAKLIESDEVKDLNFADRQQVRVHLWVCWHCRRLVRQILWLGQMARQSVSGKRDTSGDLEARIIRNLSGQV